MIDADIVKCDIYKPDYIFSFRDPNSKFPGYGWFHSENICGYTYAIYFKNTLVKIGCGYPAFDGRSKKSTSYGERIIRQVNNFPEGPEDIDKLYIKNYGYVPKSKNGRDIVDVIKSLEIELNQKIKREDIYVQIWDITNVHSTKYHFIGDDKQNKKRAEYFEALLVDQYKRDNNNRIPIGNRKEDPSTKNNSYTNPKMAKEAGLLINWS
jgi:hypothetical protein